MDFAGEIKVEPFMGDMTEANPWGENPFLMEPCRGQEGLKADFLKGETAGDVYSTVFVYSMLEITLNLEVFVSKI